MSSTQSSADFFVSYTEVDQAWAEWIAWTLESDGWSVVIQAWDFGAGSHFVAEMQQAAQGAQRTLAVLSKAYLASTFGEAEWQAAWAADPTGKRRKLLVVRVENCERPGLLSQIVSIDIFGNSEKQAEEKILRAANEAASVSRTKPSAAPSFPAALRGAPKMPFPPSLAETRNSKSNAPPSELVIRTTSEIGRPISISYEVRGKDRLEATIDYQDAARIVPSVNTELQRMQHRFGVRSVAPLTQLAQRFSDVFFPSEVVALAQNAQIERLRIAVGESSLLLPWELSHDGKEFLALNISILNTIGDKSARTVLRSRATSALIVEGIPEIYGGQLDSFPPDSNRTVRRGDTQITRAVVRDRVELMRVLSGTPQDLLFLNFHSTVGQTGDPIAVVGRELIDMKDLLTPIETAVPDVVVLSACESAIDQAPTHGTGTAFRTATALPESYVLGVIGWLDEQTARQFEDSFCKSYFSMKNVERAVMQARRELFAEGCEGWWRYSLFGPP